jgi:hypothetical protein
MILKVCGGTTMELVLSPMGLIIRVIDLPRDAGLVRWEIIFASERNSQVFGNFFGVNHLVYRIRPPPRPP